eukprot:8188994-Karenia_brevis.AAC.1
MLGLCWGFVGAMLEHVGATLRQFETILGHLGIVLEPSWCQEGSDGQSTEKKAIDFRESGLQPGTTARCT